MSAIIVAIIAQWIAIALLAVMVFVLLRQVGVLHERMGPVGALTLPGGIEVGEPSPAFDLVSLQGDAVRIGPDHPDGRGRFLFFLSPTCPICKSLLPVIKALASEHAVRTDFVLASDGEPDAQAEMIRREKLERFPLVLSTELGMTFGVGKLPYAVLIDGDGIVRSKGLANNREHLESLFEAERRGVATIQDYVAGQARN